MNHVSKRNAAILMLLIPPLLLLFSALTTADSRVGAQAVPSPTPCVQSAPPFDPNATAAPTSTASPCLPTPTPLPAHIEPIDGTPTPSGTEPENQSASASCPNNGPEWAVIAAGDELCFIEAVRYSNGLDPSALPYQIYLTGNLTFDGVTLVLPAMRRVLDIWGNNSWFTVSGNNRLVFRWDSAKAPNRDYYVISHMKITNNGDKRDGTYGGAIRNFYALHIYDSVFDNNAADYGGGAILGTTFESYQASSLHLERVHFTNNRAGGGGAIQMDYGAKLEGDCVRFENNGGAGGAPGGYGQSVLLGSYGGSVSLTHSGMRTRYVSSYGSGIWPQLFNLTADPANSFKVSNSYIKPSSSSGSGGSAAAVVIGPELDVSANVWVTSPHGNDPTLEANCAFLPPQTPPTLTPPDCTFTPLSTNMVGSRAPIPNNPPTDTLYVNPSQYVVQGTQRFTDYTNEAWVYLTQRWDKQTYTTSSPTPTSIWIKVKDLGGQLSNCASMPIASQYTMPSATNALYNWTFPTFTTWPVAETDFCTPLAGDFQSLGINGPGVSYYRDTHYGIDIFVASNNDNAAVYSIANNGLVVGINQRSDTRDSHGIWRAALPNNKGYAVIVRYGHLFVLYGHLVSIEDAIWVGAQVQGGTKIGTIGPFRPASPGVLADRHLHLEVHSFGTTVEVSTLSGGDFSMDYTGILPIGGTAEQLVPPFVYDVVQYLNNPVGYIPPPNNSKDLFSTANLTPTPTSIPQEATTTLRLTANGGECNVKYRTVIPENPVRIIQEVAGYRGFATFVDSTGRYPTLVSPLTETSRP